MPSVKWVAKEVQIARGGRQSDVLMDLAACDQRKSFGDPCGARHADLATRRWGNFCAKARM